MTAYYHNNKNAQKFEENLKKLRCYDNDNITILPSTPIKEFLNKVNEGKDTDANLSMIAEIIKNYHGRFEENFQELLTKITETKMPEVSEVEKPIDDQTVVEEQINDTSNKEQAVDISSIEKKE